MAWEMIGRIQDALSLEEQTEVERYNWTSVGRYGGEGRRDQGWDRCMGKDGGKKGGMEK